jgi:hypothetical protein
MAGSVASQSIPAESGRCEYCGGGLRHELFRFLVMCPEGRWVLCPDCAAICLTRIRRAHAEAGAQLDAMWSASGSDDNEALSQ